MGIKNKMLEMESRLLKSISDNNLYVVRKIKELSQAIKLNGEKIFVLTLYINYIPTTKVTDC